MESNTSATPQPRAAKQDTTAAPYLFWFLLLLTVILPLGFMCYAFVDAQRQHRIVTSSRRVQAKVLSSAATKQKGSHGDVYYTVSIAYEYEINGKSYKSDQLAPLSHSGSERWANAIVSHYTAGQWCDAFYNPSNPQDAILLRSYSVTPYNEMIMGAFLLGFGSPFVLLLWAANKPKLLPAHTGWFLIKPESTERQRQVAAGFCTVACYAAAAVPFIHYSLCLPQEYRDDVAFGFYFKLGLIPLAIFIRYWWISRNMKEAELLIDQSEPVLGETLRFTLTQTMRRQLQLNQASLRLICFGLVRGGKTQSWTALFQTVLAETKNSTLKPGENLTLSGEVMLPSNQPPSGRDATAKFDEIIWKILFRCNMAHAPDYSTEYVISVRTPAVDPSKASVESAPSSSSDSESSSAALSKTSPL